MANLTKVAQKIFAGSAGVDEIAQFGSLFASGAPGTFTTDPATVQALSNFDTGWFGAAIDGNSPAIEDMNALFFLCFYQLAYIMQKGVPEWDVTTTYYSGSMVLSSGVLYSSLSDSNTGNAVSSETYWKIYSDTPVGSGMDFYGPTEPRGWIFASGLTIGDASSTGTGRANADTFALFSLLWTNYSNSILPIYTSTGVLSTRGASAAIDFAAHKKITLIDKRGRVSAGRDNMGGTTAGLLTSATISPDALTLGATGGEQVHILSTTELAAHTHLQNSHTHTVTDPGHVHLERGGQNGGGGGTNVGAVDAGTNANSSSSTVSATTGVTNVASTAVNLDAGGGGAHNNVQPTLICNYILKL